MSGTRWPVSKIVAVSSAAVLGLTVGIPVVAGALAAWDSTTAGQVAVVRNGGPFSNSNIRAVIKPASSLTWTGIWSTTHKYPATQSSYTITADAKSGDQPGVDVVSVPSSDGVQMGIEGTLYYTLNTAPATIRSFDDKFGTRSYAFDGHTYNAYGGTKGWNAFVNAMVRPVLNNALRQQIGNTRCADLVSSCALVQNNSGTNPATGAIPVGNVNIAKIQDAINATLATDIKNTLGGDYLIGIQFSINKVTLPANVQTAVDQAQSAFAAVSQSQAKIAQAKAEADANAIKQQGYNACPACAQQDILKSLPQSVTVFAPGSGTGLPLTGAK